MPVGADQPAGEVAVRLSHHSGRSGSARQQGARSQSATPQITDTLRQQQEAPLIQPFLQGLQQKAKIAVQRSAVRGPLPVAAAADRGAAAPAAVRRRPARNEVA